MSFGGRYIKFKSVVFNFLKIYTGKKYISVPQ